MVDVARTFTVEQPSHVIVAYLRDFANAVEWDPGTQRCEQVGADPIGVGTRWHNVSKLYGITTELTYELTVDDPDRLVFVGANKTATTSDDLSVRVLPDNRTSVTYHAQVRFNGVARAVNPIAQLAFNRLAESVPRQMTEVLNGL
ncbi:SRPBCC family protein [Gordonia rhizosphera]|uniref:Polyketide cyclase/dehydrase n=1 Tax=Gordonia rhizosphera NBRC 16068 TaxID=1108045 RepID=K6WIF3_9ACTN|nr:SRPBCC family protein [Gordonia rhizosphera]GAB91932.1 hypothetical protein GORHZ_154_00210 [Gordonia rhizosphera NBRC 16068]